MSNIVAPRLPNSTVEYDQNYINELTNILRLYFNQVDSAVNRLSTPVTVADLRSAVVSGVGARGFVIDSSVSTFGSTVAGGGSTKVPVYSDGTNWKVG
jgi:hypothetical protein